MEIGQTVFTIKWIEIGRDRVPVKVVEGIITGFPFDFFIQTSDGCLHRREDVFTVKKGAELSFKYHAQKFKTDYWKAVTKALNNIMKGD